MNVQTARRFLLWCTVINYAVLMAWFGAFAFAHDWLWRMQGTWYRLTVEQFDALNYLLMGTFKLGILLFNLVPLIALWIVGGKRGAQSRDTRAG